MQRKLNEPNKIVKTYSKWLTIKKKLTLHPPSPQLIVNRLYHPNHIDPSLTNKMTSLLVYAFFFNDVQRVVLKYSVGNYFVHESERKRFKSLKRVDLVF